MELDPDIQAMKRANRKPLWITLAVLAGGAASFGLWVLSGLGSVRSTLEAEGHTEIEVKIKTPFEFGYTSKKGTLSCGGSITRLPGSTQRTGSCFGVTAPEPKPKPERPQGEVIAEWLRTRFPKLPVSDAHCPVIAPGVTKATCTLESDAGAPLELAMEREGDVWSIKKPARILARATFADSLGEDVGKKIKAQVAVDCGSGLFGYSEGEKLTCSATRKGAKKAGSVEITFAGDGSYKWSATGV